MAFDFRMPAEWETHEATWLAWPHEATDWPGKFETIPWVYGSIVRHLAAVERVRVLVQDREAEQQARAVLEKSGVNLAAVEFYVVPTDRSWTRDTCSIFVCDQSGELKMLNWRFNGWAKYENSAADDAITPALAEPLGLEIVTPAGGDGRRIVLEGGSIDVNGAGTLLTTEECLLSDIQARNPGFLRQDYEAVFERYLGVRQTIWLKNGIAGDDTHGHVDDLARFIDEGTIVIAAESDPHDANFEPLRENLARLRHMQDRDGEVFRIVKLPMPAPQYFDGQRLPASYANFYIANDTVLVPTFNDPQDRIALDTLADLFPARTVIGIASTDLVLGLGTLHCMTQQQPRV